MAIVLTYFNLEFISKVCGGNKSSKQTIFMLIIRLLLFQITQRVQLMCGYFLSTTLYNIDVICNYTNHLLNIIKKLGKHYFQDTF